MNKLSSELSDCANSNCLVVLVLHLLFGNTMNKSSSRGIKLTTVIFAVIILALSAVMSNSSVAGNTDVAKQQST